MTAGLLILLSLYYIYKFKKYYDASYDPEFNFLGLALFILSITLMLFLLLNDWIKYKVAYIFLFFTIGSAIILSSDLMRPGICNDCAGNIEVAKSIRNAGLASFLMHYHDLPLYVINNSPSKRERFVKYDIILKLNYKNYLLDIEKKPLDAIFSYDKKSTFINHRISKHPPLWFCVIFLWQSLFSDSYYSHVVLSNLIAVLYLASLYALLGVFLLEDEYRNKLKIVFLVLLLPIFLNISGYLTNDMVVGIFAIWLVFYVMTNNSENINKNDCLAGIIYSVSVLFKFTMLPLLTLIVIYYMVHFRFRNAVIKLITFVLCASILPLLSYVIFNYNMILNLMTTVTEESSVIAERKGTIINIILWYGFHEMYGFGMPLILLLATHFFKVREYLTGNEVVMSLVYIAFFLSAGILFRYSYWSRIFIGYLPFIIPLLTHVYHHCGEKKKLLLTTCIFLAVNNLLVIMHELIQGMIFS